MTLLRKIGLILVAVAAALGLVGGQAVAAGGPFKTAAFKVKHVFIIVLENKSFSDTFGTSTQDPYLQGTLVPQGTLLTQYYGTGHVSLDNYISMVSGQAPTQDTTNDCLPGFTGSVGNYNDVVVLGVVNDDNRQVKASGGCIYPKSVKTIVDQLAANGLTWKGYMGDMGNDPARESATCGHPAIGVGTDNTNSAEAPSAAVPLGDAYATRHNPFMYFHSIIDSPACKTNVVNLGNLATDLLSIATTPNYIFITPNLCDDGHDGNGVVGAGAKPCANGNPGGLTSADAFLKTVVPQILASPAYKQDGLLIITFDESNYTPVVTFPGGVETIDITFPGQTCCNQQPGPNLAGVRPGSFNLVTSPNLVENIVINGFGGDQVGALLISPFVKAGGTSAKPYNHYSMLRTLEDIFKVGHLGYAQINPRIGYNPGNIAYDSDVFISR